VTHRSYSELIELDDFFERFRYLALGGSVGEMTFGFDRWMNQEFYHSRQWKTVRQVVIARDLGCDLAMPEYEIHERIYIHHMNPMDQDQLLHGDRNILDPECLISTSHNTHNAIHYGDESLLPRPYVPRRRGDTKEW